MSDSPVTPTPTGQLPGWELLRKIADSDELMEIGRKAIEDDLIEWRDSGRFMVRANGFTIRSKEGEPSTVIRYGPEWGVRLAMQAIAAHLKSAVDAMLDQIVEARDV